MRLLPRLTAELFVRHHRHSVLSQAAECSHITVCICTREAARHWHSRFAAAGTRIKGRWCWTRHRSQWAWLIGIEFWASRIV